MKSILLNYSDFAGGAAIAAYRTHQSLRSVGVDSTMWVNKKVTDDWSVMGGAPRAQLITRLRSTLGIKIPELLFSDEEKIERSYNWISSAWAEKLNASQADLVHLQWINAETVSIRDLSKIKKPMLLTMHDMWAFCGGEHYTESDRWVDGYSKQSKPDSIKGVDIDRCIWKAKRKHWGEHFQLVAISDWLASCVKASALFKDWPITVIPNPIDTTVWKPLDKKIAREAFNLPIDKKILLFGALGGTSNPRKGYELLDEALSYIKEARNDIHLVVYGQGTPEYPPASHFPITYAGRLSDPSAMCMLNNAADVHVNPSIQEAFGQTASEAHACGLPVVAFNETGIADIVEHRKSGYLASHSDARDLANGILWVLDKTNLPETSDHRMMRATARERAVDLFSYDVVGQQYRTLYENVIERTHGKITDARVADKAV